LLVEVRVGVSVDELVWQSLSYYMIKKTVDALGMFTRYGSRQCIRFTIYIPRIVMHNRTFTSQCDELLNCNEQFLGRMCIYCGGYDPCLVDSHGAELWYRECVGKQRLCKWAHFSSHWRWKCDWTSTHKYLASKPWSYNPRDDAV
jgi:hypothetical protein